MTYSIGKKYLAAKVMEYGHPLQMVEQTTRPCEYGEICVEITRCGVCHTDLHVMDGDWEVTGKKGVTLGHEGVGKVVDMGQGVDCVKLHDRVCLPWLREACGYCIDCIEGEETCCAKVKNAGFTADGSFARYVYAPAKYVGRVPDSLSDDQAAPVTCAGVTVYKALRQCNLTPGRWVAVVGAAGGLGHLCVQYAKKFGAKVVGIDCGDNKMKYLKSIGAHAVVNAATTANIEEVVMKVTGGGPDAAVILVPRKEAVGEAIRYVKNRGTVVAVALPSGNFETSVFHLVARQLTLKGSIVGHRQDLADALQIAADGDIHCDVEVRPFNRLNSTLEDLRAGKVTGRVVLDISKE